MPDPIACFELLSTPFLLSPLATPNKVKQCIEGTPKNSPTAEDFGRALMLGGLIPLAMSMGGGKIARSAARLGGKAAAAGRLKQIRNRGDNQNKNSSTQGMNQCDAVTLGLQLGLGISPFGSPILLSPVGTPEMFHRTCSNPNLLVEAHSAAVDATADFIGDVFDFFSF